MKKILFPILFSIIISFTSFAQQITENSVLPIALKKKVTFEQVKTEWVKYITPGRIKLIIQNIENRIKILEDKTLPSDINNSLKELSRKFYGLKYDDNEIINLLISIAEIEKTCYEQNLISYKELLQNHSIDPSSLNEKDNITDFAGQILSVNSSVYNNSDISFYKEGAYPGSGLRWPTLVTIKNTGTQSATMFVESSEEPSGWDMYWDAPGFPNNGPNVFLAPNETYSWNTVSDCFDTQSPNSVDQITHVYYDLYHYQIWPIPDVLLHHYYEIIGNDIKPPISSVLELPLESNPNFNVEWAAVDNGNAQSGVKNIDVQYKLSGSTTWVNWLTDYTGQNPATFSGSYGNAYYFRSRGKDNVGHIEDWPANYDAYTNVPYPPITLITPTNNSTNVSLTPYFSWNQLNGATYYNLQVSLYNDFSVLICNQIVNNSTNYIMPAGILEYNKTYYWRCRAENPGIGSRWSAVWNFTTIQQTQPTIAVTSPNGGENWQVGSSQNITWSWTSVSNVKIEYTTNNGSNWTPIIASTPCDGLYSWTIPNTPSAQCKVRITDVTNASVTDQSDAVFTISAAPYIAVTSPNGGENWQVGSSQNITWSWTSVSNVKIEYTTNNGSNWTPIIASTPCDGLYSWTIPNTPSAQCKVRITDVTNASVTDQSDAVFTISAALYFTIDNVSWTDSVDVDGDGYTRSRTMNITITASQLTGGLTLETWAWPDGQSEALLCSFTTSVFGTTFIYTVPIGTNSTCGSELSHNKYDFRILLKQGSTILAQRGPDDDADLNNENFETAYEDQVVTTFQLSVSILNGWNMVSVPGINPAGQGINNWWINHTGNVFKFVPGSGYSSITTTAPGEGYWMKNTGAEVYNTGDEWPAGGIQIVPHTPISVAAKWNMFGGYEGTVDPTLLTTTPAGQLLYPVYKFVPGTGYQPATQIVPGFGYWVKLSSACLINVPNALAKSNQKVAEYIRDDWGKITITDAAGSSYTVYAVKGQVDLNQYELPPLPPAGLFDVRFGSGRIAEDINSAVQSIEMRGITYPVKVKVENVDIRLQDVTGKEINANVKAGEEITISNPNIDKIMVSVNLIPDKYSLEQNYPNPFNPSTTIEFSLPENVKNVRVSIYNILGQKVAELVNGSMLAGKYQYQWNAKDLASGIYIYELRTEKFVSIKKLMLLK